MRLGLYCNHFNWAGGEPGIGAGLAELAREAEGAGFSSFWLMDHFFQLPRHGEIDDPMLEAYTALGFIAAVTERMQLGTMVTGVTYRHPGVLVKAVTTLDVLSGGRAALGIGAAWFDREHEGLGVPFPPLKTRFELLEETLQIAHQMWSDDRAPYKGRHYHLAEPISRPRPVTQPHPPIVVGGRGERKTLRLVAKYGDACNFSMFHHGPDLSSPDSLAEVAHKLEVLRGHCEAEGRPFEEIERTVLGWLPVSIEPKPGSFTPDAAVDVCRQYAELGFDHLMIATSTLLPKGSDPEIMAAFREEIVPRVKVEGRGSRVEGRGSRVEGRGSRVEGRKNVARGRRAPHPPEADSPQTGSMEHAPRDDVSTMYRASGYRPAVDAGHSDPALRHWTVDHIARLAAQAAYRNPASAGRYCSASTPSSSARSAAKSSGLRSNTGSPLRYQ